METNEEVEVGVNLNTVKRGSVIAYDDKHDKDDLVCPNHWLLKYANGCKYDCQYCNLHNTLRMRPMGMKPHLKNERVTAADLKVALREIEEKTLFNTGQLGDSLVFLNSLVTNVVPIFENTLLKEYEPTNPHGHKMLIVTKDTNQKFITWGKCPNTAIMSYSINAKSIAQQYEFDVAHPWDRIAAAKRAIAKGYEVRLRIDPIMPVNRWDLAYYELIERIMQEIPEVTTITLGFIVGTDKIVKACTKQDNDITWRWYTANGGDGLVLLKDRLQIYGHIIQWLRQFGYEGNIALCKEPQSVWKELELDWENPKCNCVL